ncbi:uncharacterized protein CELE_K08H2.4 [Caenorhabditis elegans]|uniref:Uncharacterized protein n=1 Tax=Caenorhabditis elegans TaxID=6239 RepID=Q21369_CAEEL|nr:Uncharacterized protein CELE_K08H2.4 [Caenorhabditis elegans]CAA94151.2 Uncharacterized protein CELE_K08H2.4 [Caenorhabditis elegans]
MSKCPQVSSLDLELTTKKVEKCPTNNSDSFEQTDEPPVQMSAKLRALVEKMYSTQEEHTDVFPASPKKGEIVIPTGGLAKCVCSPNCKKELPQPAYLIITEHDNNQWMHLKNKNAKKVYH